MGPALLAPSEMMAGQGWGPGPEGTAHGDLPPFSQNRDFRG